MKKAGKLFTGVTALLIAFSLCSLTACSDNNTENGVIEGNYAETTTEELNATLSEINTDNIFGDATAADYKFGLELSAALETKADLGSNGNSSASLSAGYKILTDGDGVKGAGNVSLSYKSVAEGLQTEGNYSVTAYNDATNLYIGVDLGEDSDGNFNAKLNYFEIIEYIMSIDYIPAMPFGFFATDASQDTATDQPQEIISALNEMGISLYLDDTDGVKIKLSASEQTFWSILSASGEVPSEMIEVLGEAVTINSFKLDYYFALDNAGVFNAASVVTDVNIQIDTGKLSGLDIAETDTLSFEANGYVKIAANPDASPEIPEGIENDVNYIDITATVKQTIGEMINGGNAGTEY